MAKFMTDDGFFDTLQEALEKTVPKVVNKGGLSTLEWDENKWELGEVRSIWWDGDTLWILPASESENDNPLAALRDILPDIYGRKEHAARLIREQEERECAEYEQRIDFTEKLESLKLSLCGPYTPDEAGE